MVERLGGPEGGAAGGGGVGDTWATGNGGTPYEVDANDAADAGLTKLF